MLFVNVVSAFILDECNSIELTPAEVRDSLFTPFQKLLKSGLREAKQIILNCEQAQFNCVINDGLSFESHPNYESCNDLIKTVSTNAIAVPVLVESILIYKKLHPKQEHPVVTDFMLLRMSVAVVARPTALNQFLSVLPVYMLPKLANIAYKLELNEDGTDFLPIKQIFKHERYVSGFEEPFEFEGVSLYLRTRLTNFVSSVVFLQQADYWIVTAGGPVKIPVLAQMFSYMTRENGRTPDGRNAFRAWLYNKGDTNYELTVYLISTTSRKSLSVLKEISRTFSAKAGDIGSYFDKIKNLLTISNELPVQSEENGMIFQSSTAPVLSTKGSEVVGVSRKSIYQSLDDLVGSYWNRNRWADQLVEESISKNDNKRIYEVMSLCSIAHHNKWHDATTNSPTAVPETVLEAIYLLKSTLIGGIELPMKETAVVNLVRIAKSKNSNKKQLINEFIIKKLENYDRSPPITEIKSLLQSIYE